MKYLVRMSLGLIFFSFLGGLLRAQSPKQKERPTVVTVDVVLKPAAPSPVPVPYPNVSLKYSPNKKDSKMIAKGQSLTFTMSGKQLERLESAEVYSKGSRYSKFGAKLEQLPKGKNEVRLRKIIITVKENLPASTIYRINFRPDLRSKPFYSTEFVVGS